MAAPAPQISGGGPGGAKLARGRQAPIRRSGTADRPATPKAPASVTCATPPRHRQAGALPPPAPASARLPSAPRSPRPCRHRNPEAEGATTGRSVQPPHTCARKAPRRRRGIGQSGGGVTVAQRTPIQPAISAHQQLRRHSEISHRSGCPAHAASAPMAADCPRTSPPRPSRMPPRSAKLSAPKPSGSR